MAVSEGEIAPGCVSRASSDVLLVLVLSCKVMEISTQWTECLGKLHLNTLAKLVYRLAPRFCHSFSNSARAQNDFCVPTFIVESAAYKFARRRASFSGIPSPRKTAKLPM